MLIRLTLGLQDADVSFNFTSHLLHGWGNRVIMAELSRCVAKLLLDAQNSRHRIYLPIHQLSD